MEAETLSHVETKTVVDTLADRVAEVELEKLGKTGDDVEVDTLDNTILQVQTDQLSIHWAISRRRNYWTQWLTQRWRTRHFVTDGAM